MLVTAAPTVAAGASPRPPDDRRGAPRVSAVLVVHDGGARLSESLDALAASSSPPDRLVVVASSDASADLVRCHEALHRAVPDVRVVEHPHPVADRTAVALGLDRLGPEPDEAPEWLWLLSDDTTVEPSTLRLLVEAVRRSPSVAVAGPKVVARQDPRRLVEAGLSLTRSGRRLPAPVLGELDQGQYDHRTDVLAVGGTGMLVRRSLFEELGGFDPAFADVGGDLDFGWRTQLAGHRVVLVPGARLRDARATLPGERGGGADPARARRAARRAGRRVCLARCSLLVAPLLAAWIVLAAVGSAALLLLLKRPRAAWDELGDLGAVLTPLRSIGARWRFRGKARLRRRDLATLFVRPGQAALHVLDEVHDALTPSSRTTTARTWLPGLAEPGPVADEAEAPPRLPASLPRRIGTHPGFLAVVAATVVGLVGLRDAVREGLLDGRGLGVSGGQLLPATTDAAGLWHAYRDSWHGSGLGAGGESSPHLAVLAALTWVAERLPGIAEARAPAAVTTTLLLVLGMPLATACAYLAARVVTPARWVRAGVALAWGTTGVLAVAIAEGRVTAVLAAALLPLAAAGVARTASRSGTVTAAFATALALAVLGALVPLLLVLGAVIAAVLVVAGPDGPRRARALVLLLVPVALQGPSLLRLRDPARVLAGPGLLAGSEQAPSPPWLLALGSLDSHPTALSFLAVPLVVGAVLALSVRTDSPERSSALAGCAALAVVGLVLALGASRVVVGDVVEPGGAVSRLTPWAGVGVQLLLLAVLAGILVGSVGRRRLLTEPPLLRRAAAGAGLVVVTAAVLGGAALVGARDLDATLRSGGDAVPPVAVDQARSPAASRLLALDRAGDGIGYELVGAEPGEVVRGLGPGEPATDPGVAPLVSALATGVPAPGLGSVGERLADLGVGFVAVSGAADDGPVRSLDGAPGVTRLGSAPGGTLWRVLPRASAASATEAVPAGRVRITTAAGAPLSAVPTTGPHATLAHDVAAGPTGRRVVVAEPYEWADRAQVRFDGVLLAASSDTALPTYELPERAGRLTVDLPPVHDRWLGASLGLAALVVYLAVPFGNRRSRTRP